ncbi:MAG: undecaprenyl diphosphate synthase family protein [Acutalibacteraceae bacterium]
MACDLAEAARAHLAARTRSPRTYQGFQANICINYGGRDEIVHAARRFAADCVQGLKQPEELTECDFAHLSLHRRHSRIRSSSSALRARSARRTSCSGSRRMRSIVSQDVLWPDLMSRNSTSAIASYRTRERRFGGAEMKQRLLVAAIGVPLLIVVLVILPPVAAWILTAAIAAAAAWGAAAHGG